MKKLWSNTSGRKKFFALAAVFLLVFGAYFGYHVYTAHADQYVTDGVINDISQLSKEPSAKTGTKENPFLVLEMVPYQGYAEIGYMIEGCEPIDFSDSRQNLYNNQFSIGNVVTAVFVDEYERESSVYSDDYWHLQADETRTATGYYEKVSPGEGNFVYNGTNQEDTSGLLASGTVYRPVFEKVAQGAGDFIWVSAGDANYDMQQYQQRENKYATSATEVIAYEPGDREYTTRTDTGIYSMSNQEGWEGQRRYVHFNMFLRTALQIRTRSEIADYHILVKTVEPSELNEHPEWLDYADLVYMHEDASVGAVRDYWQDSSNDAKKRITKASTHTWGDSFSASNDYSWEVVRKLFLKVNALEEYDGEGQYPFAPLMFDAGILNSRNSLFSGSLQNVDSRPLDYTTLEAGSVVKADSASNSNLYKFLIMNFLMKQENFYQYFFCNKRLTTNDVVIQTVEENGVQKGICSSQLDGTTQDYWNQYTFLPVPDKNYQSEWSDELIELYEIQRDGNAFLNYSGNVALNGGTFMYNSDNMFSQFFDSTNIQYSDAVKDAFEWYKNEYGEDYSSISPVEMIHYLLNYKKSGDGENGRRTKNKSSLKVLEIEPCNSFTLTETYLLAYLPASKYEGSVSVEHMTTQEFNGSKQELSGEYDFVYLGMNLDKYNTETVNAQKEYLENAPWENTELVIHNDGESGSWDSGSDVKLYGKTYLHVGDLIQQASDNTLLRLSGNDITSIKWKQLRSYARAGHPIVFDDCLYAINSKLHRRTVDATSNIERLVSNTALRKKTETFIRLSDLSDSMLTYAKQTGAEVNITSWPQEYRSEDTEETTATGASIYIPAKQKLSGSTLNFNFEIGYSENGERYAVRLLVDTNYDGILTETEEGSEVVYDSYASADGGGVTYACGTLVESPDGKEIEQPAQYSFSYDIKDIPNGRKNGAIAWKLIVYSISNQEYYYQKSGTSWYGGATDSSGNAVSKYQINVLQVVSDNDQAGPMNLEDRNTLFTKYAKDLDDYEITVTTMGLSKYMKEFEEVNSDSYAGTAEGRKPFTYSGIGYYYPTSFEDYNVLLISCGDALQQGDNENGAVAYPIYMATNGNSVLYTMDAVQDVDDSIADESITAGIKEILNQSRFTDSRYADIASYCTGQSNNASAIEKKYYDLSDYRSLEYTYYKAMQTGSSSNSLKPYYAQWKQLDGSDMEYDLGTQKAKTITRLNEGTITQYPYTIDESIDIQGTQAQTFQLNLEKPYANVWYCLGGDDDTTYGISPNDATNNYYLYSSENVTYSGIDLKNTESDEEMKLFINALIGTYEAAYPVPFVTVDKVRNVDEEENETLSMTMNEAQERQYKVEVPTSTEDVDITVFKEYVNGAQALPKGTIAPISSPTPTVTPRPTDPIHTINPDVEESESPASSSSPSDPLASPSVVYQWENTTGSTGISFEVGGNQGNSWLDEADDEAVIVVQYTCMNTEYGADSLLFQWRGAGNDWFNLGPAYTACQGSSTEPTEIQTVQTTYGELKQSFSTPIAAGESAKYLALVPYNYTSAAKLLSITVYKDADSVDDDSSSSNPSDEEDSDELGPAEFVDVSDEDIMQQEDGTRYTHKIFFTPYDGYLQNGPIQSLSISFVDGMGENQKKLSNVRYIYRQYRDKNDKLHIERYEMSAAGTFDISNRNYLTDSVQYFILYNEALAGDDYHYLRFDIANRKKSGRTYLDVQETIEQVDKPSDVYVFPLD